MNKNELIKYLGDKAGFQTYAIKDDIHVLNNPADSIFKVMARFKGFEGHCYITCESEDVKSFHQTPEYDDMKREALFALALRMCQAGVNEQLGGR